MTERALAAKRGAIRNFARFETLVTYLKKIGIAKYQVDATQYDPVTVKAERFRDDAAERMRQAHQAAAHDKWFRAQVEQALQEADDPYTVWLSGLKPATRRMNIRGLKSDINLFCSQSASRFTQHIFSRCPINASICD